jgi:uncharacterized protein with NRDE domain
VHDDGVCLLALAVHPDPAVAFVLAANRDEAHDRPTRAAHRWEDAPRVVGGRDLRAGGAWLGVRDDGRFAAITNVRDPAARREGASRGEIVRDYLVGDEPTEAFCDRLAAAAGRYPSFNLILGDARGAFYVNEISVAPTPLGRGVHALSNARLDVPWPKVTRVCGALAAAVAPALDEEALFAALADERRAADDELPSTGVPLEWERVLSSPFIRGIAYGTRASTVAVIRPDGPITLEERSFGPDGVALGRVRLVVADRVGQAARAPLVASPEGGG